jgi:hypothetical protein
MGWVGRYFRWTGDGWTRLPARWVDRFMDGAEKVEPADGPMMVASLYVLLDDRIVGSMAAPHFGEWPVQDGTYHREHAMRSAVQALKAYEPQTAVGNAVHAEGPFARRRNLARSRWHPTMNQLELLAAALEKTGIPRRITGQLFDVSGSPPAP